MRPLGMKQSQLTRKKISESLKNKNLSMRSQLKEELANKLTARKIKASEQKLDAITRQTIHLKKLLCNYLDGLYDLFLMTINNEDAPQADSKKPIKISSTDLQECVRTSLNKILKGGARQ